MIGKIIKGKGFGGAARCAMQKDDGAADRHESRSVADRNDADDERAPLTVMQLYLTL